MRKLAFLGMLCGSALLVGCEPPKAAPKTEAPAAEKAPEGEMPKEGAAAPAAEPTPPPADEKK